MTDTTDKKSLIWESSSDIPNNIISMFIALGEDLARELLDSEQADQLLNDIMCVIHPNLPIRITAELMQGNGGERYLSFDPNAIETRKIQAIKSIRAATGFRLSEAKILVEAISSSTNRVKLPHLTRDGLNRLRVDLVDSGYMLV